jgi:hypothetical protein
LGERGGNTKEGGESEADHLGSSVGSRIGADGA